MGRTLARLHMWAGIFASLPLILISVSGLGLSFLGTLFQWETGALTPKPDTISEPIQVSVLIDSAIESQSAAFTPLGVFAPQSRLEVPAVMVFGLPAGARTSADAVIVGLDPHSGDVLGAFTLHETWSHTLLRFHHHMLIGDTGTLVFAVTALFLIAFIASGLTLWFRRKGTLPAKLKHASKLARAGSAFGLHSITGVTLSALLIIWASTGLFWSKPDWFASLVPAEIGRLADAQATLLAKTCEGQVDIDSALNALERIRPGASYSQITLPNARAPYYTIAYKTRGDLDRYYGDHRLHVSASCPDLIASVSVERSSLGANVRALNASIHSGRLLGPVGPFVTSVLAVALLLLVITGAIAFFKRTRILRIN